MDAVAEFVVAAASLRRHSQLLRRLQGLEIGLVVDIASKALLCLMEGLPVASCAELSFLVIHLRQACRQAI